jgi:exosortase
MTKTFYRSVLLLLPVIAILFFPILRAAATLWMTNDNYSHGIFIFPIVAFMLWLKKDEIEQAEIKPTYWGLLPLVAGLALELCGYLLDLPYIGMWSLVPVLAGCILMCGGLQMWKVVQFPICYILLAGSIPTSIFAGINQWIQHVSTVGAAWLGQTLGFVLMRHGNYIEVPGMSLEVMMACSGYKKLVSLITFALLYGFLFTTNNYKRILLVLMAVPIAVCANCLRITGLIAASSEGGIQMFHVFHTPTDLIAIVVALLFIMVIGKGIGCKNLVYSW